MSAATETLNRSPATAKPASAPFDVQKIREDFPILHQQINGHPLVYLDNAATSQKPRQVIDAMSNYYLYENSNIHRGVHTLGERATRAYELARGKIRRFINAAEDREIVFVRGTTEAINLVAHTFGSSRIQAGDEVVISEMEHHSNIVPWQILRDRAGIVLKVARINDAGELDVDHLESLLTDRTKLVSIVHISNALGTINPIEEVIALAHKRNIPVLIDGAQAVPHGKVDVRKLDADFYAFSGHKMYGPTGLGILYGKANLLNSLPPFHGGGDMIKSVTFAKTTYNDAPYRFEAGTPHIAGAIALGAAVDYMESVGIDSINAHEVELYEYARKTLAEVPGLQFIGNAAKQAGAISFTLSDIHPHDIGTILDSHGIAIRVGHHCAQPVMERYGVPATARASLGMYNTKEEIDALFAGLKHVLDVFDAWPT